MPQTDRAELAAIFAGGFLGAVLRCALGEGLPAEIGTWPWATSVAVAASLTAGAAVVFVATKLRRRVRVLP